MLAYNTRIATKSLRRNPLLTTIIIAGIALGICASTTFTTVRHMFARDPLPGKSDRLFYIRMDSWGPEAPHPGDGRGGSNPLKVPPQLTYRDTVELMRSNIPVRQSASFVSTMAIYPDPKLARPFTSQVRIALSDYFTMFGAPFQYGGPWDRRADKNAEQVIVIDHKTNEKVFGGGNSVGKQVRIEERNFTVVGVLQPWRPFVRVWDLTQNPVGEPEPIYMPFSLMRPMQIRPTGNTDNWKSIDGTDYEVALASEVCFIQYWVELKSPADAAAYQRFMDDYVRGQKKIGRFPRPMQNSMVTANSLMREWGVIRPAMAAMAAMSILFLGICALNLTGLLLAKFLARAPEVSVRRALGATRTDIFLQHIVECELVGVVGGVIGMALSLLVLKFIGKLIHQTAVIALDMQMILAALFLSLIAGLLAGLYPAWRICKVQPAVQLKV